MGTLRLPQAPPRPSRLRAPLAPPVSPAGRRCSSRLTLQLTRPGRRLWEDGSLSEWSAFGGRLATRESLDVGDWVELRLPSPARAAVPPGLRGRAPLRARVVSAAAPDAGGTRSLYGVEFPQGLSGRAAWLMHRLTPALAVLLFAAGTVHVAALKAGNVDYFWYSPLANFYSLLISFYILSRFALSACYRPPPVAGHRPSVTVVIACKNEEEAIGRTIDCIFASDYPSERLQVIAVNDGSTDGTLDEMRRARERHPDLEIVDFGRNLGKRHGMAAGARRARGEILVYVDSDSFVRRDTIFQLVQGFADPEVGAVCGHASIQNANRNFLTRMQEVRYYVAFRVVKAAESVFGTVACCSGCLAAYRRSYVMPVLDSWLNQTFLGKAATFGDDRSLTNFILRRYRVVYNHRAHCTTLAPESWRQFFRQQLRWKKSWIRETFIGAGFMWRRHPLAAFFYYLGAIFPVVAPVVVFNALVAPPFLGGRISLLYVYGATLMAALYGLYYLARRRSSLWVYGVAFSFFYMLVLVWQTYYALLTVRLNHWGTR